MTCSSHKFVVININSKAFFDLLFDVIIDYRIRFSRTGRTQYHACPERIYDVYPSVIPFSFCSRTVSAG